RDGRVFDERDAIRLAALTTPLIHTIRQQPIHRTGRPTPDPPPPAILLLDGDNTVATASRHAQTWLAHMKPEADLHQPQILPAIVYAAANTARTGHTTHNRQPQPTLTRTRTQSGHWLVMHARP